MSDPKQEVPVFMGPLFIVVGALLMIFGEPSPGVAPWVAYLACSLFIIAGIFVTALYFKIAWIGQIMAPLIVLIMGVILTWIAFSPGERQCTGTMNLFGFESKYLSGCRLPFGIAAVFFWTFFGGMLLMGFFQWLKGKKSTPDKIG